MTPNDTHPRPQVGAIEQERRAELQREQFNDTLTVKDKMESAFKEMNASVYLYNHGREPTFEKDPKFKLTPEMFGEASKGIDESFHDELFEATSQEHLEYLQQQIKDSQARTEKLYAGGMFSGLSYGALATLLDPIGMGVSIAGGALPAQFYKGYRSMNQARLASAAAGAASTGVVEGYIAHQSPTYGTDDVMWSMAFGAGFGSMFTGLSKQQKAAIRAHTAQIRNGIDAPGTHGTQGWDLSDSTLDPDESLLSRLDREAAETGKDKEKVWGADFFAKNPVGKALNLIRGRITKLEASDDPRIRLLGEWLGGTSVGFKNAVSNVGAILKRDFKAEAMNASIAHIYADTSKKLAREFGKKVDEKDINEALTAMLEGRRHVLDSSPALKDAHQKLAATYKSLDEIETAAGMSKGSMDNYHHRVWSEEAIGRHPDVFERAFVAAMKGVDPAKAARIAKYLVETFKRLDSGRKMDLFDVINGDQRRLTELLDQGNLTADQKDALRSYAAYMSNKDASSKQGATFRRHKMRLDVDAVDPTTGRKLTEFIDQDVRAVMGKRIHRGIGRAALAKLGIKNDSDFQTLVAKLMEGKDVDSSQAYSKALNSLYNNLMGRGVQQTLPESAERVLATLQKFNVATYMNQMGLSSVVEFGSVWATVGFTHALKTLPKVRALHTQMMAGNVTTAEVRMLRAVTGSFGQSRVLRDMQRSWDAATQTNMRAGERGAQKLANITMDISGHSTVLSMQQMVYATGAIQDFMKLAQKADFRRPSYMSEARLRDFGLGADDVQEIVEAIKKNSTGDRIEDLGYDAWPAKTQEKFSMYLYASGRKYILEPSIADTPGFMDSSVARALFQFMGHGMASFDNYVMRNLKHRDAVAAKLAFGSMALGGLSYMALTYSRSMGRPDQESYLRESLTAEKIGKAAFQRSSMASLFPNAVDSTAGLFGQDPVFGFRSSGLQGGFISGSPMAKMLDSVPHVASSMVSLAQGEDLHRQDIQAMRRFIPFQNAIILQNYLNHLQQSAPYDRELK